MQTSLDQQDGPATLEKARPENGMTQVGTGFVEAFDRILRCGGAAAQAVQLRKDEPHPMPLLPSSPQFRQHIGKAILPRGDKARQVERVALGRGCARAHGLSPGFSVEFLTLGIPLLLPDERSVGRVAADLRASFADQPVNSPKSVVLAALNQSSVEPSESVANLLFPECIIAIASKLAHDRSHSWKEFYDNSPIALPEAILRNVAVAMVSEEGRRAAFTAVLRDQTSDLHTWFQVAAEYFPHPFVEHVASIFVENASEMKKFIDSDETIKSRWEPWNDIALLVKHRCLAAAKRLLGLAGPHPEDLFRSHLDSPMRRLTLSDFVKECRAALSPQQEAAFARVLMEINRKHGKNDATWLNRFFANS